MALLKVLRQDRYAKQAKTIRRLPAPIIEADRRRKEIDQAVEAQRQAIVRLLGAGFSPEEVMEKFRTTEQTVAEAFLLHASPPMEKRLMPEIFKFLQRKGWTIDQMAKEACGGDATPFLDCAHELGEDEAIQDYWESFEGDSHG